MELRLALNQLISSAAQSNGDNAMVDWFNFSEERIVIENLSADCSLDPTGSEGLVFLVFYFWMHWSLFVCIVIATLLLLFLVQWKDGKPGEYRYWYARHEVIKIF